MILLNNCAFSERELQLNAYTEVLDAGTFLTRAETNYYGALYGYMISLAELERAVGRGKDAVYGKQNS